MHTGACTMAVPMVRAFLNPRNLSNPGKERSPAPWSERARSDTTRPDITTIMVAVFYAAVISLLMFPAAVHGTRPVAPPGKGAYRLNLDEGREPIRAVA